MVGMPVSLPFTEADIRLAAGARSFERGLEYLDAVQDLRISDGEVTASVYGNSEYTVCLIIGDQRLSGGCTCPYGQDGFFCKHCVAVGLSVLEMGEDAGHLRILSHSRQHRTMRYRRAVEKDCRPRESHWIFRRADL